MVRDLLFTRWAGPVTYIKQLLLLCFTSIYTKTLNIKLIFRAFMVSYYISYQYTFNPHISLIPQWLPGVMPRVSAAVPSPSFGSSYRQYEEVWNRSVNVDTNMLCLTEMPPHPPLPEAKTFLWLIEPTLFCNKAVCCCSFDLFYTSNQVISEVQVYF